MKQETIMEQTIMELIKTANDSTPTQRTSRYDGQWVVIRTRESGCHFGVLVESALSDNLATVYMEKCQRIWSWQGANTLTELSIHGPKDAKLSQPTSMEVMGVCEIIPLSKKARKVLQGIELGDW